MLSRRELMYGKIAVLERVVKDILINGFMTAPNPTVAAEEYAEIRKTPAPGFGAHPDFEIARQELWNVFLDDVVGSVRGRQNAKS
jgi:hypothetical protein